MAHTFFKHHGSYTLDGAAEIAQRVWIEDTGDIDNFEISHNGEVALIKGDNALVINNEYTSDGQSAGFEYATYAQGWEENEYGEMHPYWEALYCDGAPNTRAALDIIREWVEDNKN